jgi:hypothetical protein
MFSSGEKNIIESDSIHFNIIRIYNLTFNMGQLTLDTGIPGHA